MHHLKRSPSYGAVGLRNFHAEIPVKSKFFLKNKEGIISRKQIGKISLKKKIFFVWMLATENA